MKDAMLRAPVACPECAQEILLEFPATAIARALASGDAIRLFASCHDKLWNASFVEREQLREYLEATKISRETVPRHRVGRGRMQLHGRGVPRKC